MQSFDTLAQLLAPEPVDRFLAEVWEQRVLRVAGGAAERFVPLLSATDLDRVITTLHLRHPEVSLVDAAHPREPGDYTYGSGLIDPVRLYRCFDEGSTILLSNLELRHAPLASLCRALERELGHRAQANVYFTPGNAQGFKAHYDNHDVLVLQVQGSKHWLLYDTPVQLPFRGQEFDPASVQPGEVSESFVLRAGDVLYVPRGRMHDARTTDEDSLHVTIGIMARSWTDLLAEALALVGQRDVRFRRALPPGFHREGFDPAPARAHFAALLDALGRAAPFDETLRNMQDELLDARQAIVPGQLAQLRGARALTADTPCGARAELMHRTERAGDEVVVHAHGRVLALPAHVEPALRHAIASPRYTARDLPGDLDEAGRLVLLRRLVREGMVRTLDAE